MDAETPIATLADVRVPLAVAEGLEGRREGAYLRCDLHLADGRIVAEPTGGPSRAMGGAIALPGFVDCHTHLDKGQIWARKANPDGTFNGALTSVAEDRTARWTEEDVATRMAFMLESAYAHGSVAVRTHIDSGDHRTASSWAAFAAARETWRGRITLQAAALTVLDDVESEDYRALADLVAGHGGILGAVTYPMPDLDARLDIFLRLASERGLDVDFHVDETLDPASNTLERIALAVMRNRFQGRVLCGHCCSLSTMAETDATRTIARVAEAGLSVVSLPLCNLYLQDRHAGRTPRLRGVTLVHELAAAGVPVAFASDNTRDPFYAYGDLDMIEVMRQATRIGHLDHSRADWT
ncbi:MAG: cytosine deaminase, partial [Pseudomonadota bacterium]